MEFTIMSPRLAAKSARLLARYAVFLPPEPADAIWLNEFRLPVPNPTT
jgi:hypothetical protein